MICRRRWPLLGFLATGVPVVSTNVLHVGYDPPTSTLRVRFRRGGTYDYYDVNPGLFEQMLQPHPWRRIGQLIKAHTYAKIA